MAVQRLLSLGLILTLVFLPATVSGALQGAHIEAEGGIGGYLEGKLYVYRYSSSSQIYHKTNLTLEGQVSWESSVRRMGGEGIWNGLGMWDGLEVDCLSSLQSRQQLHS